MDPIRKDEGFVNTSTNDSTWSNSVQLSQSVNVKMDIESLRALESLSEWAIVLSIAAFIGFALKALKVQLGTSHLDRQQR